MLLDAAAAVVVLTPLPLVITANAAVGRRWAHHAIGILGGLSAGVTFLFGALDLAGAGTTTAGAGNHNPLPVDIGIMITAVIAAALVATPVRQRVARPELTARTGATRNCRRSANPAAARTN